MSVASNPLAKSEPLPPYEYVIVKRTQFCDCCGAMHSWSETYSRSLLRPRLGLANAGSELQRISKPRYRVPIRKRLAQCETIPFCHSCYEPSLANTPDLIEPPLETDVGRILNITYQTPEEAYEAAIARNSEARAKHRPNVPPTQQSIAELLK